MASQRRHNRPRKARGRFRGLYRILAILAALAALTAACVVFFRVQTVRVEGSGRYTPEDILQVSGIRQGDYLALLNTTRITRQLRAELPYLEYSVIRRVLPDTVVIVVEESAVSAAVQSQGQWWLINGSGKLLETVPPEVAAQYPTLSGVELLTPTVGVRAMVAQEEENRWSCAMALLSALADRGEQARLNSLDCGTPGVFTVGWDGRYTLLLPTTVEYQPVTSERFRYFLNLLDDALPQLENEGHDLVDFTLWESTGRIYARHSET